jgi:2-aminoadipate transaminase
MMKPDWKALFSENIKSYEGYAIGKLLKFIGDPEIISLAGGLPSSDLFLDDALRATSITRLENDIEKIMQYSDITGETGLIDAVIDFLKADHIRVSPENVLITSSGQQGLDLTGRLFLNPGDVVLIDRPTFAGAIAAFQMQRPLFAGVDIETDGSCIEGFREKIEFFKTKNPTPKFIYVVPDFQNPSGITMSLEKRNALLDLSVAYGIPIVEDSPYRYLRYYGETLPSLFSLDQRDGGGNVIGVYTFSKLFCPGMRVGFNIGPKAVIEKMTNIKEGSTLNTPKYNQDMCAAFLQEMGWHAYIRKAQTYYREKLSIFYEAMNRYFPEESGVSWTRPEGGLFSWVTLPETIDTLALFYEAINYKVAFVPGYVFYCENPSTNRMRINFSYPSAEQLKEAIKRLATCVVTFSRHQR